MVTQIGILGGTFDPIHNGHLYLARKICRRLSLDKLIIIPAYIPPHKKGAKISQARHRYNMLKLAVSGNKKLKISNMEIKRKGKSYSVETLRRLRKRYGAKVKFFFITGSDSLKELDKWKNMKEILNLCKFVVVERPGFKAVKRPGGLNDNIIFLKINAKNISATMVRERVKRHESLTGLVSQKVMRYIYRNELYI